MSEKSVGFLLGLFVFIVILTLPTFETFIESATQFISANRSTINPMRLAGAMQAVLALTFLMIIWWVTETIPLPATALLPAVILPLFHITGISSNTFGEFTPKNVFINYANPVIFLFLGGFLIAAAMRKWKLDYRLTLWLLTRGSLANSTRLLLLAMMGVTAFLSMWVSNTATAAMMLPLGIGVLTLAGHTPGESHYGKALMLGIAWAASIGGVGTIIGTPPNGIALGILNTTFAADVSYHRITFLDWMKFGIPYVVFTLPLAWVILLTLFPPETSSLKGGKEKLLDEKKMLGRLSTGEKGTIVVFLFTVVLWITNPFWRDIFPLSFVQQLQWIDEYSIGLIGGVLLFIVPANIKNGIFLLEWKDTKYVEWGTLILFGGGIALSDAMFKTGLAQWIASSFIGLFGTPSTLIMMFAVVFLIDFLTEVTSNTAVTSMIVPVVISIAQASGQNPITLSVAAAVAASMAFMLPVATPPNALVYSTGYIKMRDMIKAGFILDITGWLMTIGILIVFGCWLFGVFSIS
jgi:sodium-dependent dicarboxylate transporter 2/3/5